MEWLVNLLLHILYYGPISAQVNFDFDKSANVLYTIALAIKRIIALVFCFCTMLYMFSIQDNIWNYEL